MAATAASSDFVWQDREIVFDAKPQMLECRRGEVTIDSINSVEDTKDLKLRGSIVKDGELILLPKGNLGTFFMTNVRLVWHANLANNFNVSLPYMQIKSLRVREKLEEVYKEIMSLHQIYGSTPIFGVDFSVEAEAPSVQALLQPRVEEDVEITEEDSPDAHAVAAYYVEGSGGADFEAVSNADITFDAKLGLSIESLQGGVTLDSLWRVV
ncbi:BBS5 [Symbiodinium microadriaticum]|nr:BBS5 [Symbiodinium microadriaticum]